SQRPVHVRPARRDQGDGRRLDAARPRLDQRHLRERQAHRSAGAGRQRLRSLRSVAGQVQEPVMMRRMSTRRGRWLVAAVAAPLLLAGAEARAEPAVTLEVVEPEPREGEEGEASEEEASTAPWFRAVLTARPGLVAK